MRSKSVKKYFKKSLKMRKYNNIIEALYVSKIIRKLGGISIFVLNVTSDNRVIKKFTLLGFLCFLVWHCLYFYCTYKAFVDDQTVLRSIYSTKIQRYGDDFEKIAPTIYVIFAMWKIPYTLSVNTHFMEIIVNVDKTFENLGEIVDYNEDARSALQMSLGQMCIYIFRLLTIWIALSYLNVPIPIEKMYQVVFPDALQLITTALFCFFLMVVRRRFKLINKMLADILLHKSWEHKVFVRTQMTNVKKAVDLQDRYICDKIKACAKMYGKLYKVTDATNIMFGILLTMTMFVSLCYIILYMFYFMEATAAGMFHDVPRYIVFLVFVFWQIGHAFVIIFMIVYFCERAVYEAKNTSFIIHEVMNSDLSQPVTDEAMQLSIQLLHQTPIFTAGGLYELNYALLHQGARSVATYLIILLQFVTDVK